MAIQIRRGTQAQWEAEKSNIVAGEPAIATDTGNVYVGTGSGTYTELANIGDLPEKATATPLMDGTASVGSSVKYAAEDHVHPHDTSKADNTTIGSLSNLTTTAKNNVVAAINEIDAENSEIKGALNELDSAIQSGTLQIKSWVNGGYDNSIPPVLNNNQNRIRPRDYIYVKKGDMIQIDNGTTYSHAVRIFKGEGSSAVSVRSDSSFSSSNENIYIASDGFMVITFADKNNPSANINVSDFDGAIVLTSFMTRETDDLMEALVASTGDRMIPLIRGAYLELSGATVNMNNLQLSSNYAYAIHECSAGDVFLIKAYAENPARAFAFVDSNYNVIQVGLNKKLYEVEIVAPQNTRYLCVTTNVNLIQDSYILKVDNIPENSLVDYKRIDSTPNGYINLNIAIGETVNITSPVSDSSYRYFVAPCVENEIFHIIVQSSVVAWAFLDENKTLLQKSFNTNEVIMDYRIVAPANAAYVIANGKISNNYQLLRTKKLKDILQSSTDVARINVLFEKGKYDDTADRYGGPASEWGNYMINRYPIILGENALYVYIPALPHSTQTNYRVIFRDSTGATKGAIAYVTANDAQLIRVAEGAFYCDIEIAWTGIYELEINVIGGDSSTRQSKRIYINSNDQTINYYEVDASKNLYSCLCFMMPPNYSFDGEKVPLVVWFDGNGNYNYIWSKFSNAKLHGLQYVRDEGYAVMKIFPWGNKYWTAYPAIGWDGPYPIPTSIECIKRGIEYICDRYNVDIDNVHIMSKSMGGIISTYFISNPICNFKSIGMFSPAVDVLALNGRSSEARHAIAEDLNFTGENLNDFFDISIDGTLPVGEPNFYYSPRCQQTWLDNFGALIRINPAWTNLSNNTVQAKYQKSLSDAQDWHNDISASGIYNHTEYNKFGTIPVKFWAATADSDVPYLKIVEIYNQLMNAGLQAELRIAQGKGHSIFDVVGDDPDYLVDITTDLGISYTDVPIGWVEGVEWIKTNSSK